MRGSLRPRIIGLTVAVSVIIGVIVGSAPADAVERQAVEPVSTAQLEALGAGVDPGGTLFDGAKARAAGASIEQVEEFAAGWTSQGGSVANTAIDRSQQALIGVEIPRSCRGKNSFDVTGLQANLYINSCVSSQVQKGLLAGAALATLIGAVTAATGGGAAASAIAAAGLALGAAVIAVADHGRGVVFYGNPIGVGIKGQ